MGFNTVRDGEMVAVWDQGGNCSLVRGPKRFFTCFKKVEKLTLHAANQHEYLVVTHKNGIVEHIPGPTNLFRDPLLHNHIRKMDAISLTSHEVLVAYSRHKDISSLDTFDSRDHESDVLLEKGKKHATNGMDGGNSHYNVAGVGEVGHGNHGGRVDRRIIQGPCIHVPKADEWIHQFVWHGNSDKNDKCRIIPEGQQFQKLKTIADQFYYNIRDVRTKDDALIAVKVMIFYELTDIEIMLDSTADPIGDFSNACCADVVALVSQMQYEDFVECTGKLNDINTYTQLTSRAASIGFSISKVAFRGYHACENLQQMHNNSIEMRTQLRLESETERQRQCMSDITLRMEGDRAEAKMKQEEEEQTHRLKLTGKNCEQDLYIQERKTGLEVEQLKEKNDEKLRFYRELRSLGVDLSHFLTAEHQPHKQVNIINGARGGNSNGGTGSVAATSGGGSDVAPANIHLHSNV
eukprot:TRINITY_DN16886_c0_g1_i1.p1 TRINITY_DN16886_c0_g1~~TRINITY_DN16886_c0_g1_i1.p1  ORF type:complete len:464 (+),score=109.09 TRINITY_DN16886_c0_g1_i1:228-1619(+)